MMRSSSLPRLAACPGSAALPQANTSSAWSEGGTDRHAWLAALVTSRDASKVPAEYYEAAIAILERVPDGAGAEVALSYENEGRVVLSGHADVVAVLFDRVLVVDFKGFERVDAAATNRQTKSYAAMAAERFGRDKATVIIAYVRENALPYFDEAHFDELELAAELEEVRAVERRIERERAKVAAGLMPDVAEGRHCKYCPAAHACPSKVALVRHLVDGTAEATLAKLSFLSDEDAATAWERIAQYTALLGRMKAALMARASQKPIPLRNGMMLAEVSKLGNESLDGDVAWQVVNKLYGRDAADEAVTREASKKQIDAIVRKYLQPGDKLKDAKERVYKLIRDEGGSERKTKMAVEEVPAAALADGEVAA